MSCSLYEPSLHKIDPVIALLERTYQDNLILIKSKVEKPSLSIELIDYKEKSDPLMKISDEINAVVKSVVTKAKKFKESKQDIQNRMWNSVRYHTDSIFSLEKRLRDEKA